MFRFALSLALALLVCGSACAQQTAASLFPWRDSIHQRLQNLENKNQQAPAPQNDGQIQALRDQIAQLNAQIAALMAKGSSPQQQPIILLMPNPNAPQIIPNPGTPQIIPNPGTPQIIPNPGTPPIQINPGTPQINPNPGVPKVNPNPGTPPIQGAAPPPTGYQTFTDRPPTIRPPRLTENGRTVFQWAPGLGWNPK